MTKLGQPIPQDISRIRRALVRHLRERRIEPLDAESTVTGRDFLLKIWDLIVGCPLGIAIVSADLPPSTVANIFYEIGLLQALGKETLVVKTKGAAVPSDFVRTEYIEYDRRRFASKVRRYFDQLFEQADHYATMAENLETSPPLAIDYLKRAYLITGENRLRLRLDAAVAQLSEESELRSVLLLP
jgi:hypothetical protein